jgi:hypothetical protein
MEELHDKVQENQVPEQNTPAVAEESDKERNLRVMRERALAAERRVQEYEAREKLQAQKSAEPEDYDPYEDAFVDRKTLKKERRAQEDQLKKIQEELAKVNTQTADMKLRVKYNDFDSIVNADNLQKLSLLKPSLYQAVASTSDYYAAGETAYEVIKTFVNSQKTAAVDKKLEENKNKPRSSAGTESYTSNSPLTMAHDYDRRTLTPERKAQLQRQVNELKKFS